jgi:hypothetical protein
MEEGIETTKQGNKKKKKKKENGWIENGPLQGRFESRIMSPNGSGSHSRFLLQPHGSQEPYSANGRSNHWLHVKKSIPTQNAVQSNRPPAAAWESRALLSKWSVESLVAYQEIDSNSKCRTI